MQTASPVGATQTAHPTSPGASAAPALDRDESIRSQTSLKVAGELYASEIVVTSAPFDAGRFAEIYEGVKGTLDGKTELDQMLAKAKETFDDHDPDDDIPFG